MIRLTRKQRLLGAALLVAGLVWAADHFIGSGRPAALQAAQTAAAPPPASAGDARDFSESLARLTRNEYISVADEIDLLQRDLFEPTAIMESAFALAAPPPARTLAESAAQPPAPEDDFQTSHKLEGVLLGRTPLAVIDGHVLAINSDLDGYTLLEVQRDRVIFQHPPTGARVVLELSPGPRTP
jgi:hypothetical protein